jgi:hypothetical protein
LKVDLEMGGGFEGGLARELELQMGLAVWGRLLRG